MHRLSLNILKNSRNCRRHAIYSSSLRPPTRGHLCYVRNFSSDDPNSNSTDTIVTASVPPVDPEAAASITDAASAAAMVASEVPADPNFVVGKLMAAIDYMHVAGDMPYWGAIVLVTIGIRVMLLPVAYKTIQGSARMAVMRPEMQKVQAAMQMDPNFDDMRTKSIYQQQMVALFKKYKVNPMRAMLWPLAQFPVFIASFLALKDMSSFYPGLQTGGTLWFVDLSAADPYYLLPVFNSLTFLLMIELGADGVKMDQQKTFQMVMRGLGVAMVPLTMYMPTAVFVYWTTNNVLSLIQTGILKQKAVKKFLDIPEPPPTTETPDLKIGNPFKKLSKMLEEDIARGPNAKAEILSGGAKTGSSGTGTGAQGAVPGPPPTSFAMPPRKQKKNRTR